MKKNMTIIKSLISIIKPLWGYLFLAVCFGVAGFLCAQFIPIIGVYALSNPIENLGIILLFLVLGRALSRYLEQTCNHYLAFKVLAHLRDIIFTKLKELAPAKLETKDKGNLISLITTDIELLEVFYAHTLSPIFIAIITSIITVVLMLQINITLGLILLVGYVFVGVIIPWITIKKGRETGLNYRNQSGALTTQMLGYLRGIHEVKQYQAQDKTLDTIDTQSKRLNTNFNKIKIIEASTQSLIQLGIFGTTLIILMVGLSIGLTQTSMILTLTLSLSTFGPSVAIANLSNNLLLTIASGKRVVDLLAQTPETTPVVSNIKPKTTDFSFDNVSFAYDETLVLANVSFNLEANKINLITGKSGLGKSTILRLLMRFWNVEDEQGVIRMGDQSLNEIDSEYLKSQMAYITQDTILFKDTLKNNITLSQDNYTTEMIKEACDKAALTPWIETLPQGLDTEVEELGDNFSAGEKQRIGIARALLANRPILLLDEPTSNLDSLNEGIILNALKQIGNEKTIIMVSHRPSTQNIADVIINLEECL